MHYNLVMIVYCSVDERYTNWKQEQSIIKTKINELFKNGQLENNLDDSGYVMEHSLLELIESLQVLDDNEELSIHIFQWASNTPVISNELIHVQQLPFKQWSNYWEALCID